jgi:hypothetical protein
VEVLTKGGDMAHGDGDRIRAVNTARSGGDIQRKKKSKLLARKSNKKKEKTYSKSNAKAREGGDTVADGGINAARGNAVW